MTQPNTQQIEEITPAKYDVVIIGGVVHLLRECPAGHPANPGSKSHSYVMLKTNCIAELKALRTTLNKGIREAEAATLN